MRGGFPPEYVENLDRFQVLDLLECVREIDALDRFNSLQERRAAAVGEEPFKKLSQALRRAGGMAGGAAGGFAALANRLGSGIGRR